MMGNKNKVRIFGGGGRDKDITHPIDQYNYPKMNCNRINQKYDKNQTHVI